MLNSPEPTLADVLQQYAGHDPQHVLIDDKTAAACIHQKRKTLESWRRNGRELRFVKLGRQVRYRLSDILDYIDRNTFTNSREAMAREHRAGSVA